MNSATNERLKHLLGRFAAGDRLALARLITLVVARRPSCAREQHVTVLAEIGG